MWPHSIRYGREVGTTMLVFIMAMAYAATSPIILPFALAYFIFTWCNPLSPLPAPNFSDLSGHCAVFAFCLRGYQQQRLPMHNVWPFPWLACRGKLKQTACFAETSAPACLLLLLIDTCESACRRTSHVGYERVHLGSLMEMAWGCPAGHSGDTTFCTCRSAALRAGAASGTTSLMRSAGAYGF